MPDDQDRRELFDLLEAGLGTRGAALLMAHLPPVGWSDLATKSDLALLRGEVREVRAELRGEMAELRADFDRRFTGLLPKLWAANVATMIGLAGLVFAVASFAR